MLRDGTDHRGAIPGRIADLHTWLASGRAAVPAYRPHLHSYLPPPPPGPLAARWATRLALPAPASPGRPLAGAAAYIAVMSGTRDGDRTRDTAPRWAR